jgi:uncharacterized protein
VTNFSNLFAAGCIQHRDLERQAQLEKGAILIRAAFFAGFLALVVLVQRFWFVSAWQRIQSVSKPAVRQVLQGMWIAALVLFLATFLDPFLGGFIPRRGLGLWLIAVSRLWLFASFFAFLAFQLVGGLGWTSGMAAKLIPAKSAGFDPARRDFFRYAAYVAGTLPFVAAAYGFAAGRFRYQVRKVEVPIADLPKGLDGMKIVQLSDIHAGDFMPREEVQRAVDMANDLNADLAVVTGDFISNERDPLEECIADLSKLRAPLGTWGCNGNHEIYADAEATAQQAFERYGMTLLRQQNVQLERGGQKFNLIGVDYQRDHMTPDRPRGPMLQEIEPLVSHEMPNILLSHNPNSFHRAADLGIELSLAGHTHGGQVKVEIVDHDITPARLITDFVAGLYHLPMGNGSAALARKNGHSAKSAFLYVNRGLGTFGMPVRLGVPPEITLLTLRSA